MAFPVPLLVWVELFSGTLGMVTGAPGLTLGTVPVDPLAGLLVVLVGVAGTVPLGGEELF